MKTVGGELEHAQGAVWQWTSSFFDGYPGFRAFPYAEYSEVFFGEDYRVLRGGSWVTDPLVARPTFRNWDLPQRRQIFSGIRCASRCLATATSLARRRGLYEATRREPPARPEGAAGRLALRRARLAALRGDHPAAGLLPAAARGEILRARSALIAERTQARTLVELGVRDARRTRGLLLDALSAGTLERFVPLDVSERTLRASAQAIAAAYPRSRVDADRRRLRARPRRAARAQGRG